MEISRDPGSSNQVICDNPEGHDRVGGGREIQEGGDICDANIWQKATQYCKAIILQLKMNRCFKKKRTFHVSLRLCESIDRFLLLLNNVPLSG